METTETTEIVRLDEAIARDKVRCEHLLLELEELASELPDALVPMPAELTDALTKFQSLCEQATPHDLTIPNNSIRG